MTEVVMMMTTNKLPFFIDKEDEPFVASRPWCAEWSPNRRTYYIKTTTLPRLFLHRILLTAPDGVKVDHRNSKGFDNRRKNIRLATSQQNTFNRSKSILVGGRKPRSKYKGVTGSSNGSPSWRALIRINGKQTYLGSFANEIEAAIVYDEYALSHYGEFAKLNFPAGPPTIERVGPTRKQKEAA